jgi:prepilin-type N-terminal cleavage/methylation domain-containing protein
VRAYRAFTLIELMIAVVIVGVVAAIAVSRFGELQMSAAHAGTAANFQSLIASVHLYYGDNRELPRDRSPGVFPSELNGYLRPRDFLRVPPLGGVWDWNGNDANPWRTVGANMSIYQQPAPIEKLLAFDRRFDDGTLNGGSYRAANTGNRNYCWFIQY